MLGASAWRKRSESDTVYAKPTFDDGARVEMARARDPDAFEALVVRHRARVYGLALRMMREPGEAEEVVQETFLSAWQNLGSFRAESSVGSWLYRICANFCLMRLRHRKADPTQAPGEESLPAPDFDSEGRLLASSTYDWSRGAEEKALDHELRQAIEGAVAILPDAHRLVFLLKDVQGLSYEEIATATGATVPALKTRLHRARLAMREAIDAFYANPGHASSERTEPPSALPARPLGPRRNSPTGGSSIPTGR